MALVRLAKSFSAVQRSRLNTKELNGARGGSRTHMRKNPRRILSPQRLPFRHPGSGTSNLTNRVPHRNSTAGGVGCAKTGAIFWLGATALFHQPDRSQTEVSQLSRDADSVFPPSELESASSPSWRSVCDNFCQLRDGKTSSPRDRHPCDGS